MDTQTLINTALSFFLAALGWFARQIWDAVDGLRDDVKNIEIMLPTNYVQKNDFVDAVRDIRHDLDIGLKRIYDKLDGKADK